MVKRGDVDLVTSFMLEYENGKNRFSHKKKAIADFMSANESYYVGIEKGEETKLIAGRIMESGGCSFCTDFLEGESLPEGQHGKPDGKVAAIFFRYESFLFCIYKR
jgi:hypothetical protein